MGRKEDAWERVRGRTSREEFEKVWENVYNSDYVQNDPQFESEKDRKNYTTYAVKDYFLGRREKPEKAKEADDEVDELFTEDVKEKTPLLDEVAKDGSKARVLVCLMLNAGKWYSVEEIVEETTLSTGTVLPDMQDLAKHQEVEVSKTSARFVG